MIVDCSGSVGEYHFGLTKMYIEQLVLDANIDNGLTRIGMVTYSSEARLEFKLDNYTTRADMIEAVRDVKYVPGSTNTADALRLARAEFFKPEAGDRQFYKNIVILFTDGGSDDMMETLEEARLARLAGITILVVAIGDWVNLGEVREIASDPDDLNVFQVGSFEEFQTITPQLKRSGCNGG